MSEQLDEIRLDEKPREETPQASEPQPEEMVAEAEEQAAASASEMSAEKAEEAEAAPQVETAAESDESAGETTDAAAAPEASAKAETSSEEATPEVSSAEAETTSAAPEQAPAEAKAEQGDDNAAEPAAAAEAPEPEVKAEEAAPAVAETAAVPATAAPKGEAEGAQVDQPVAEAKAASPEPAKAESDAATSGSPPAAGTATDAAAAPASADTAATPSSESPDERQQRHQEMMGGLAKALESETPVKGKVIGWNKGGFHVAIDTVAAFCPVSQIEIGNPKSPKRYMDRTFRFRIIEIEEGGRRVVLSRAAALKAEREARAAKVRETLSPGLEREGRVSSLTNFGAFVDLGGGIEGLVHISEISRRRVEHPKEMLRTGQKVKVSVLKIENDGERISLSMKKLERDPWEGVAERYPTGTRFEGKIMRKADFGLFVEVEPGLEGLVHTSRLPLGMSLDDESLEVGSPIEGWVHQVEGRRRRMALSLREVSQNDPWKGVEERFPVGGVYTGQVERVADFGAFIELEPGLTGLLPFSAVQSSPNANLRRQYHPGKKVSIRVLSVDTGKRRISLGTESSKAVGTQADYKEYMRKQRSGEGLNAMAAAFARARSSD